MKHPEIADVPHVQRIRPMGFDSAPDAVLPGWVADLPGSGALLGALDAGVPMPAIPQGADQFTPVLEALVQ